MTKPWQPYAKHILDAIAKIRPSSHAAISPKKRYFTMRPYAIFKPFPRQPSCCQKRRKEESKLPRDPLSGDQRFSQHPGTQLPG
jgi:hypothetical protein